MVPTKFINEKLKEHSHYYAAHLAIARAEREYGDVQTKPYAALKSRRNSTNHSSGKLMLRLSQRGHDIDGLKEELEAAKHRHMQEDRKFNPRLASLHQDLRYLRTLTILRCSRLIQRRRKRSDQGGQGSSRS